MNNVKNVLDNPQNKSLLTSFKIEWNEGFTDFSGKVYTNWSDVQHAFNKIYEEHGQDAGYTKVKVHVLWDNGKFIIDRIDVGNNVGDYSPRNETVGDYLKRQQSVMYEGNLQIGDRLTLLSFKDNTQPLNSPKNGQVVCIELSNFHVLPNGSIKTL